MAKNKQKANTLIKRKNLMAFLKARNINRVSPKALIKIEKEISSFLDEKTEEMKQNAFINGRKTINSEDISFSKKEKTPEYSEI